MSNPKFPSPSRPTAAALLSTVGLSAAIALTSSPVQAQDVLELSGELPDSIEHLFLTDPLVGIRFIEDRLHFQAENFRTNLSDHEGLSIALAPSGCERYEVIPPIDTDSGLLLQLQWSAQSSVNATIPWDVDVEFVGLEGTAPTLDFADAYGRQNGNEIYVQVRYETTGAFSFTGVRVDIDGPLSSPGVRNYVSTNDPRQFVLGHRVEGDQDPGPMVEVVVADADADGLCDDVDPCLGDHTSGDGDDDGVCDDIDNCPALANPDQIDANDDGVGDACQPHTPAWTPGESYAIGALVSYEGEVWQVRVAHTAVEVWSPPGLYALWHRPQPEDGEPWADQTRYAAGSLVTYGGATYEALVDMVSQPTWTPAVGALWAVR